MSAVDLLRQVTAGLAAAEHRPGQEQMAQLCADAIAAKRHLVVRAGTGTGKTLAYLAAAIDAGVPTVIVTATKALQDQVAGKDLPFVAEQLDDERAAELDWAVLKGRSNYVCLQRLREMANPAQGSLELGDMAAVTQVEIKRIGDWAGQSATGDVAELDWSPSDNAWKAVSVGSDECPGRDRCPMGDPCFAEQARRRADAADIVIVNTHLYGLDIASEGAILPDHELVIFDEAHTLEDTMSDTVGVTITPGRFVALAGTVRRIVDDPELVGSIADLAEHVREVLSPHLGSRVPLGDPPPTGRAMAPASVADEIAQTLTDARLRAERAAGVIAELKPATDDAKQRALRATTMLARTMENLDTALRASATDVAFVGGTRDQPRLELAPLDVGPALAEGVWNRRTAILTSATIPPALTSRVGLTADAVDDHDVGSPFEYEQNSLLYCALHLPNPNDAGFRSKANDELEALITAAGGRTLALFTSYRAMDEAAEALRARLDMPILTQRDLPKPALIEAFSADPETCLFATAGLFQGVDVPGDTLSLVVIDRIPFPRPDDPLLSARREAIGAAAFSEIDVPRAATMLAQACGRLIRTATDRGVVAVLDRRLGTAGYRWDIVRSLPPMRRTRHRDEAVAFLAEILS